MEIILPKGVLYFAALCSTTMGPVCGAGSIQASAVIGFAPAFCSPTRTACDKQRPRARGLLSELLASPSSNNSFAESCGGALERSLSSDLAGFDDEPAETQEGADEADAGRGSKALPIDRWVLPICDR